MTDEEFIGGAIKEMVTHSVTIQFIKRKNNSKFSANYFSVENDKNPVFTINYFDSNLDMEIFIHEYCHFLQWKTYTKIWHDGLAAINHADAWTEGEIPYCDISHIHAIQKLELDADKRAVKLIEKHKLSVDVPSYIKHSNAYVLSYFSMYKNKNINIFPKYGRPEILACVPDKHITARYLLRDHSKIVELFDKTLK